MSVPPSTTEPRRATPSPRRAAKASLWRWPIVLGLLSGSGLLSALVSEGLGDVWSWFALGVPVAVMVGFSWRPARAHANHEQGARG